MANEKDVISCFRHTGGLLIMLVMFGSFSGIMPLHAGPHLEWETDEAHLYPSARETEMAGTFSFRNTGKHAVRIIRTRTTCGGCTAAEPSRKVYEPGEEGDISFRITFSRGEGVISKHLYVTSKAQEQVRTKKLTVTVHAEPYVEVAPRRLIWYIENRPLNAKKITFRVRRQKPIHITDISVDSDAFEVKMTDIEPGTAYILHVKPLKPYKTYSSAEISIRTDYPSEENPFVYTVRAMIGQQKGASQE